MTTFISSGDEKLDALRQMVAKYDSWDDKLDVLGEIARGWAASEPMTPRERNSRTYRFEEPDHVLGGFAFWSPVALGIHEVSCREYHQDAKKMYYCQLLSMARYHYDCPALFTDVYNYEPEALGSTLNFPEDSMPEIVDFVIKEPKDLLKLRVPDPEKDARLPYLLEIGRLHVEKTGRLYPTVLMANAPFSMAVGLRGYRNLIKDMRKDPAFVHDLMEFCTAVAIELGKKMIEIDGLAQVLADAWACPPNLSIQQVHDFVVPYTARACEALNKPGYFYAWGYGLAPDWKGFLRTINGMGIGTNCLFEEDIEGIKGYEKVDLTEFAQICRQQKTVLFACVQPDTIFNGPPEVIRERVLKWHRQCAPATGLAFYTSIPPGTPSSHVEAYISAYKEARYPIAAS